MRSSPSPPKATSGTPAPDAVPGIVGPSRREGPRELARRAPYLPAASRRSSSRQQLPLSPPGPRPRPGRRDSARPPSSLGCAPGGPPGNCSRPGVNSPNRVPLTPEAEAAHAAPSRLPCRTPYQSPLLGARAPMRAVGPRRRGSPVFCPCLENVGPGSGVPPFCALELTDTPDCGDGQETPPVYRRKEERKQTPVSALLAKS
uniref:Uncharacterized protein n=1 Tax=Rangifer tarandus platyrhynchus TaxID=3082113 RepID=A0ACB0FG18_RANTA|nr:unnamed protein product [Rangifer tarandus platyrhynchus]